jgi:hypothetical protein
MNKFQKIYMTIVFVVNVVATIGGAYWVRNQLDDSRQEIDSLKQQWTALTTKDERIRELESELISKRGEIERIYDDVDKVYIKWNEAELEIMQMKAQFRKCKVE